MEETEPDIDSGDESRFATKTGGYPGFLQEKLHPLCTSCGSELAFRAQLAADVFDCYFGDAGSVFVFICPSECGGEAHAQS